MSTDDPVLLLRIRSAVTALRKISFRLLPALAFLASVLPLAGQSPARYSDEAEAFAAARQTDRPVLLVFSGSDWCIPCIRFERRILADSAFGDFMRDEIILLEADFPQRTKLPKALTEQNERLAEEFNPDGLFPHILLLAPDRTVLASPAWEDQAPAEFIAELRRHFPAQATSGAQLKDVGLREFSASELLMGCGFEFTVVDSDSLHADRLLRDCIAEVRRIEFLCSEWIDTTQTSRINRMAGREPVRVDSELYALLKRSIDISRMTQGAFDVSFNGVGTLWKFDGTQRDLPDSAAIRQALRGVGYRKIALLDSFRVFLPQQGMKLGFGGIAKGYAADRVKQMLEGEGITGGVVNASGDLTAWGTRADGTPWKVGIADPVRPESILLWLPIRNAAVATSGNYEKFFEIDGVRYGHILDPRTGYPAQGIRSVTIISPSGELSDALATAVFVLGTEVGLNLIEQLPNTECIIIDADNGVHHSKDLKFVGSR